MTRKLKILFALAAVAVLLAGCASKEFDRSRGIVVVSREDGSGTRGAFVELFSVSQKTDDGKTRDMTTEEAIVTNSTSVTMITVSGDRYAIGYISLGSMSDMVKALEIDGAAPSAENIANGSYEVTRPFIVATKQNLGEAAGDFLSFILSVEGQKVVADTGYIPLAAEEGYSPSGLSGKVVVGGSSSVTPVMEKLKEEYMRLNPNVAIEVQQSDSTTGMSNVAEGICDIGMASREIKESELASGLLPTEIARDGIVVIVNKSNPVKGLTSEEVRGIFTGETVSWDELDK